MTRFLVGSIVLLVLVVGLVIYLASKNPEKAQSNQQSMLKDISNTIDIATPPAESSPTPVLASKTKTWSSAPKMSIDITKKYTATMQTSKGTMTFELFAAATPKTVNNFVFLAQNEFYNGTIFHRIIRDFMVQGGDPQGTGMGGPGYYFADEPVTRDYTRGTLAMANAGPNTNGSQFFIMTKDTPLPKNYTIFGQLTAGDDVLQKIAETPVRTSPQGEASQPTEKVTINNITINEP